MHCRVSDFCRVATDRELLRSASSDAPEATRALEPLFAQRLVADDGAALRPSDLCRVLLGCPPPSAPSPGLLHLCGDADSAVAASARRLLHPVLASLEPPPPPPPAAPQSPRAAAAATHSATSTTENVHDPSPSRSVALAARAFAQSVGQEGRVREVAHVIVAALLLDGRTHDSGLLCVLLYALLSLDSPDAQGAWSTCVLSIDKEAQQRLLGAFAAAAHGHDDTTGGAFALPLARALADACELPLPAAIADLAAPTTDAELAPLFCPAVASGSAMSSESEDGPGTLASSGRLVKHLLTHLQHLDKRLWEQQRTISSLSAKLDERSAQVSQLTERLHLQHVQHERQFSLLAEQLQALSAQLEYNATVRSGPGSGSPLSTSSSSSSSSSVDRQSSSSMLPSITAQPIQPFEGDVGHGAEWAGLSNPNCKGKSSYALLQNRDGRFTVLNKASGKGFIAMSVDHKPKLVVDTNGNVGIGTENPRCKLHVEGQIKSGQSFVATSPENLDIVRGGFSCRTADPNAGPGYTVSCFDNGMYEIKFTPAFSKRPSVFAVQHLTGETPTLIPLGYVDATKFGFFEVSNKPEVWVEFLAMGPH